MPCRIEAERRAIEEEEIRLMEAEEARKAELAEKRRVEKLVRSHVTSLHHVIVPAVPHINSKPFDYASCPHPPKSTHTNKRAHTLLTLRRLSNLSLLPPFLFPCRPSESSCVERESC